MTQTSLANISKSWANWVLLALVIMLGLALIALKPLPRPKARASRIQSVNHVAQATFTLAKTKAESAEPERYIGSDHLPRRPAD